MMNLETDKWERGVAANSYDEFKSSVSRTSYFVDQEVGYVIYRNLSIIHLFGFHYSVSNFSCIKLLIELFVKSLKKNGTKNKSVYNQTRVTVDAFEYLK